MRLRPALALLAALLALFDPTAGAKSAATTFCKCICFTNSTIIALNPPASSAQSSSLHKFDIRLSNRDPDADPERSYPYSDPRRDAWAHAEINGANEKRHAASGEEEDEGDDKSKSPAAGHSRPHHKLTCADCTRAFCLDYNLPICKNAHEEDVFTTCFQRDSLKDETVVVVFIFATAGLLAWALVKPWIDRLRERNSFVPLAQHEVRRGGGGGGGHTRPRLNINTGTHGVNNPRPGNGFASHGTAAGGRGSGTGGGSSTAGGLFSKGPPDQTQPGRQGLQLHADQDAIDIVSGSGVR
ncbi:hypothetical protein A1O3_07031 [Capronia epimyces CBS 606.96]|uniref:C2H2-type domain-containing protein n=1 Tax=Capronia epimyces CBS 606.96 TaxID=1182542 RepID=W9XJQ3_9EURO|nr:uncharacterized protein A1O3_07031 [Capronia epimyces CBS 606.96]EXJ80747.1 hypothetical protein A1O3_07031 [Capronia epimyces CBS 606.96]